MKCQSDILVVLYLQIIDITASYISTLRASHLDGWMVTGLCLTAF